MGIDADRNDEGRDDDYGECPDYYDYDEYGEYDEGDGDGAPGGDGQPPTGEQAYWRRRFLILCGGVAALGVSAWLFPGAHQQSAASAAAVRASVSALAEQQAVPSAAYGAAYPIATQGPSQAPTAIAVPAATLQRPSTVYQPSTEADPSSRAAGATAGPSGCAPGAIVLSLFTSHASYPPGARPKFSVYAVSTAGTACTLAYGAGAVEVVVTRHGQVVWDSVACGARAARPVRFTLGVPQVVTMTWDPATVTPAGCGGSLPAGATGTFDAVVMSHGQTSPVRAFKIGG